MLYLTVGHNLELHVSKKDIVFCLVEKPSPLGFIKSQVNFKGRGELELVQMSSTLIVLGISKLIVKVESVHKMYL